MLSEISKGLVVLKDTAVMNKNNIKKSFTEQLELTSNNNFLKEEKRRRKSKELAIKTYEANEKKYKEQRLKQQQKNTIQTELS